MDIKPSDKALVRDLGFRILEGEFGNGKARKRALGEYYEEAQGIANFLTKSHGYDIREKIITRLEKKVFERNAVLWKLGFDPYRQVQMLSEEYLRAYSDYLREQEC